jgi:hypothetical protein
MDLAGFSDQGVRSDVWKWSFWAKAISSVDLTGI